MSTFGTEKNNSEIYTETVVTLYDYMKYNVVDGMEQNMERAQRHKRYLQKCYREI
jgi:hypothetical protein